ncbi:MAG: hypothetical protein ACI9UU_003712, partial [Candidatus Azotimanducaceae bacterium]
PVVPQSNPRKGACFKGKSLPRRAMNFKEFSR